MKIATKLFGIAGLLSLSACVGAPYQDGPIELSEDVLAVVAPNQDLATVRVQSDGCYWWLYEGPVEATYIPLETRDGRMICRGS
ncbi:hypothetical protein HKCCE2091_15460 [Rhodobacterales bacterium HKCCE2091]|nr:hypothetical protein [Rhodobacterales bacterium HKCCE2091]